MVVTIDGVDSKVRWCNLCWKQPNGEFKLYVAIADVSHYVKNQKHL